MRMEPTFEKANEIYFRLGIIYKQQQKYQQSLEVWIESFCHEWTWLTDTSVFDILYKFHPDHSLKRTSGFRLATSTSNRRM